MADRKWAYLGLLITGFVTWTVSTVAALNRGDIPTVIASGIFAIGCLYMSSRYRSWEAMATKRKISPGVIFTAIFFGVTGLVMVGILLV